MKTEKPRIVHLQATIRGEPKLLCRPTERIWGFDTTTVLERVTCAQCLKEKAKPNGKS